MVRWILGDIVEAVAGELVSGAPDTEIHGISTDTRALKEGDIFVALKGARFDGHGFIGEAVRKGAAALIASEPPNIIDAGPVAAVRVDDTLGALHRVACWHRLRFDIPVIGITGSCGKTTVKELIAAVLGTAFRVTKSPASFNNAVGVPLSLLAIDTETDAAVIEFGTNAPGEIAALCDVARPTRALITNIGRAHLEGFGTPEGVAKEKSALVDAVGDDGTFYVNMDDRFCVRIAERFSGRRVTFGTVAGATWRAVRIGPAVDGAGSLFTVRRLGRFSVSLVGAHNVMNALAAVVVGADFGVGPDRIQEGLTGAELPPMRMKTVRKGGRLILNDAYNANPDSMRAAIDTLVCWEGGGRRIAVLGDMLELGETSVSEHREVGKLAARKGIDLVLVLGQFARHVAEGAAEGDMSDNAVVMCEDHADAARLLVAMSAPDDVILVKGSRAVAMERVLDELDSLLP